MSVLLTTVRTLAHRRRERGIIGVIPDPEGRDCGPKRGVRVDPALILR